ACRPALLSARPAALPDSPAGSMSRASPRAALRLVAPPPRGPSIVTRQQRALRGCPPPRDTPPPPPLPPPRPGGAHPRAPHAPCARVADASRLRGPARG